MNCIQERKDTLDMVDVLFGFEKEDEKTDAVESETGSDEWIEEDELLFEEETEELAVSEAKSGIVKSDYTGCSLMDQIRDAPIPTREENIQLAVRTRNGDKQAETELLIRNGRLVLSAMKPYRRLSFNVQEDLLQEGLLGVKRAAETFDETKGFTFSTYAMYWIRQVITRYVQCNYENIRIPVHVQEKMNAFQRKYREHEKVHGHTSIVQFSKDIGVQPEKVQRYMQYKQGTVSLDKEIKPDNMDHDISRLVDFMKADVNVEAEAENTVLREILTGMMKDCMDDREYDILLKRYGLYDGDTWTLDRIAKDYHVTRERIRQIESIALRKMRYPTRKKKLAGFLN